MSEEEFEKQTLNKLITDLKDIDKYTSFKNGAFIYDLGKYQGTLLVNEIERLNNIIDKANEILYDDNLCHVEKLQEIHKILGDKEK